MKISVNGNLIEGFTEAVVTNRFTDGCRTFHFTSSNLDTVANYPLQRGQACQILVEDTIVLDGFIDTVAGTYNSTENSIVVSGRSKTMDLVDSTLDYNLFSEWKGKVSFISVCEAVIAKLGLSNTIGVGFDNNTLSGADLEIPLNSYLYAETGESAFHFLQKYAQLQQLILTTTDSGDLLLTRGTNQDVIPYSLVTKLNDTRSENNVLTCQWMQSEKDLYNQYVCWSQASQGSVDYNEITGADGLSPNVKALFTGLSGVAVDSSIRPSRQLSFKADVPFPFQTLASRATWQANYNRSQAFRYTVTVVDHFYNKPENIWEVNKLVPVLDQKADINQQLLISEIVFTESLDEGCQTKLTLVPRDSYRLQIQEAYYEAQFRSGASRYSQDVDYDDRMPNTSTSGVNNA